MPLALLLSLAAGAMLCLAFPQPGWWWLAPVALGLQAGALVGRGARRGALLGIAFGLGFFPWTLRWAATDFLGPVPWAGLSILSALYLAPLGAVVGRLQRGLVRPVLFALAWVGVEWLRGTWPYGGFPWVRIGHSQADAPFGRLAAVGGLPLVAFAVALAGALLAAAAYRILMSRHATGRHARVLPAGVGALIVGLAGFLVPLPVDGEAARVVGIQGNVPKPGLGFNAERRAVLDLHAGLTERAAAAGARPDLVVWPENASDIDPIRNRDAGERIMTAVRAIGAPTLVGGILEEPLPEISNVSLLYLPDQGLVQRYAKRHPVPFAEYIPDRGFYRRVFPDVDRYPQEMFAGDRPGLLAVPSRLGDRLVVGTTICFEVAYDGLVRDVVTGGATLLVVQTNNATFGWTDESVQQLAISRMRAIEHGRSVAHVSTVGVSALIRPDGTLRQPTALFTSAVLDDDLPLRQHTTLATRLGAIPEYLGLVLLLAMTLSGLIRRRKDTPTP